MRLALKIVLAMYLGFLFVLVVDGYREIRGKVHEQIADERQDQEMLGLAFTPAVARAWRTEGDLAARYLVRYIHEVNRDVAVRLVQLDAQAPAAQRPRVALGELRFDPRRPVRSFTEGEDAPTLYTYALLPSVRPGLVPHALELTTRVPGTQRLFWRVLLRTWRPLAAAAAVAGAVALAIGAFVVWRPVRRLVSHAERVRQGDFTSRVGLQRWDELGLLAGAMDRMAAGLAQARQRLEQAAIDRARSHEQLLHANRLATVGTLAAGVAHELGTPLHVTAARARMIEREPRDAGAVQSYARVIVRQVDRMAAVIRQLLDFARREPEKRELADLEQLVAQTVEMLEPMAKKRGVQLAVARDDGGHRLAVHRSPLQQALVNLVVNAIQASEGGTVTVGVERAAARRPGVGQADIACHCLYVADEGPGIPDELLPQIFEPFVTTKDVGEGTGLGLAVVHGIVQRHGGWVDVATRAGSGARFTIYLPAHGAA